MSHVLHFLSKHKLSTLALLLTTVAVLSLSIFSQDENKTPETHPTPTIVPLNPRTLPGRFFEGQKSIIGKINEDELRSLPNLEKEEADSEGGRKFYFLSPLDIRPDMVLTNASGVAVFERIIIPAYPSSPGYIMLSKLINALGKEESSIIGSDFYGRVAKTLIYANKGIAIIGNPNTDEAYEIQLFQPMTLKEYLDRYGEEPTIISPPHEGI